jgi:demethylmenaquinone methyltransferase/2-methoxy-6-polyprenyl-1,4-benzoquinol methylase
MLSLKGGIVVEGEVCKDPQVIKEMFNTIAGQYDRLNTLMSLGLHYYWRQYAVAQTGLQRGAVAIDVCCGTGAITGLLMKKTQPNGRIIGLDLAPNMLKIARRKLDHNQWDSAVQLILGNAAALPFPDNVFDGAIIGYGLRNVPDSRAVLAEMRRVVKPGKKMVSLEMAHPQLPVFKELYHFYLARVIPRLGKWFAHNEPAYQYLSQSIAQFSHQTELTQLFKSLGLVDVACHPLTGGIVAVHVGVKP